MTSNNGKKRMPYISLIDIMHLLEQYE